MSPQLESGDRFTAEVDRFWSSGATIERGGITINLGPLDCEEGERVLLRYLGKSEYYDQEYGFAICLTEEATNEEYDEWVGNIVDELVPDRPPETSEKTYTRIDHIDERGLAVSELGCYNVQLGPVNAMEGDVVPVLGYHQEAAKIRKKNYRGDNYETRFKILTGQVGDLGIEIGEESTTAISDINDGALICYVYGDIPVRLPNADGEIGQKVDIEITGFDHDMAVGKIKKLYDEVGRIDGASQWARMQWLRDVGFGEDPLVSFAEQFFGIDRSYLPDSDDDLRDAIIAEAVRLAVADRSTSDEPSYPEVHISSLRHWVVHKLAAVFGEPKPDDDDDWFRDVMSERKGPTIEFYGDLLELSGGYYAPAPTRAVWLTPEEEAILLSCQPTSYFTSQDVDLEIRGISRVVTATSSTELADAGISIQDRDGYIGMSDFGIYSTADLNSFIEDQQRQEWWPDRDWQSYTGPDYGFIADGNPLEVEGPNGATLSMWREPVEYGTDAYWLKMVSEEDAQATGIVIPRRYRRQVNLILDQMSGVPQRVTLDEFDDGVLVKSDFVPPRPQMRWLHSIGAKWIETPRNRLQWRISSQDVQSVKSVFTALPIEMRDNTTGGQ